MEVERYRKILDELGMFVSLGVKVSQRLAGSSGHAPHRMWADPIFTKLVCHGISLLKLSPHTSDQSSFQFWDLPSACAVARCIIEAYDVLEYIALADLDDSQMQFRLLVWQLHERQRRSNLLALINSQDARAPGIFSDAEKLKTDTLNHPLFNSMPMDVQRKIKGNDAPAYLMSRRHLNQAAGIDHDQYLSATVWLSQYVHTLPMAVYQLRDFRAGTPQALNLTAMPIQYCLGFIGRSIIRMASVFPAANLELESNEVDALSQWCAIVEQGVQTADGSDPR